LQAKSIHIVAFNVPYPANYGGVIDVFHKIKYLHQLGVKIYLHCFEYGREEAPELEKLCEKVIYYPRKKGLLYSLHYLPFIVLTRKSELLIQNLLKDNYPIILEGLHCCYLLNDERLKNRFKVFRESNIEHEYYYHLFKSERRLHQKIFYLLESMKLKLFEKIVSHSQLMLIVSQSDTEYFKANYPKNNVVYLPSFHPNDSVSSLPGKGSYVLYHGNLEVAENYQAAQYILTEIAADVPNNFIIAGLNPPDNLIKLAAKYKNVKLITNPSEEEMLNLVQNAQLNLLLTFQATGLKLKLLNVLYSGRFCLVNNEMLSGTGLEKLCIIANQPDEIKTKIAKLFELDFTANEIVERELELQENYSNATNAAKLIRLLNI
jgi:hypothetical protein